MGIINTNEFRQSFKHAGGWWEDAMNAKQVQANNLNWDTTYGGWQFTNVSNRFLWVIVQMPHAKMLSTAIEPHVHWQPTTTSTDTVQWQLKYWFINAAGGGAQDAVGTSETITVAPTGTAYQPQVDVWTAVAAPASEGSSALFICEVARLGGADDHSDTVLLKDFDPHIRVDQPGSYLEFYKWGQ